MTDFSTIRSTYIESAYAKSARPNNAENLPPKEHTEDFSKMVSDAAAQAVDTVRTGDSTAIAALNGQAGLQQVVEATMAMESTVQVAVALRDKMVDAYQEVMRMPI
jgi:flagellar hook-basal body complex protein FliE